MAQCSHDYTAHYRWEWFRKEHWRKSFRERKRHSSGAFIELMREREMTDQPVLDCSCGLGLKTIVIREAGLTVSGSDSCAEAIRLAREFAEEEGHSDIPYFVSSWAELPGNSAARYAAVFNDALSWIYLEEEMAASLKGLHDCLLPGGILTYMGALPGMQDDRQGILDKEWARRTANGRHWLGEEAVAGSISMQEIVFLDKGTDFIDEHHLYLIRDSAGRRVENWCVRCSFKWGWPKIRPFLEEAGFSSFGTKEFVSANSKRFHLVVAERD